MRFFNGKQIQCVVDMMIAMEQMNAAVMDETFIQPDMQPKEHPAFLVFAKGGFLDIDLGFLVFLQKLLQHPSVVVVPVRDNDGIHLV